MKTKEKNDHRLLLKKLETQMILIFTKLLNLKNHKPNDTKDLKIVLKE